MPYAITLRLHPIAAEPIAGLFDRIELVRAAPVEVLESFSLSQTPAAGPA